MLTGQAATGQERTVADLKLSTCPIIDQISSGLHHVTTLVCVLGLVIDSANTPLLVRKALFDPVGLKSGLMQRR